MDDADEVERLKRALSVATCLVMKHEPGDSRAVSDIAVALTSVVCEVDNPESWEIIDAMYEKQKPKQEEPDDDTDYHTPDESGYSRADEEWFFDHDGKP